MDKKNLKKKFTKGIYKLLNKQMKSAALQKSRLKPQWDTISTRKYTTRKTATNIDKDVSQPECSYIVGRRVTNLLHCWWKYKIL